MNMYATSIQENAWTILNKETQDKKQSLAIREWSRLIFQKIEIKGWSKPQQHFKYPYNAFIDQWFIQPNTLDPDSRIKICTNAPHTNHKHNRW